MTKYSDETVKDDYEPEEGEIQDDDDSMEEAAMNTARSATSSKGKSEACSKNCLSCDRDESQFRPRKSNNSTYGGKPYYTPGASDDNFVSNQNTLRSRFRKSPMNKWYPRTQSSSSKEWSAWQTPVGARERERQVRETKRTRTYSLPFRSSCDQRSASNISSGNSYFNSQVPSWPWYSKSIREKNKKTNTSLDKCTDTMKQTNHTNQTNQTNQTSSLNSCPNSVVNADKNVEENQKNELEKQSDSCPASPASSNSVEIIEVPPKIPEVITIYDSDEEPCKELKEMSSKSEKNSPKDDLAADRLMYTSASETSQETYLIKDTFQESSSDNTNCKSNVIQEYDTQNNNEDIQNHLKALTLAMRNVYDEKKKQELKSQQNSNIQEINLRTVNSDHSLANGESEENNFLVSQVNTELITPEADKMQLKCPPGKNKSIADKHASQTELNDTEKSVNSSQSDNAYWEKNTGRNMYVDTQTEIVASRPSSRLSEISNNSLLFPSTITYNCDASLHSPYSLSSPTVSSDDKCSPVFIAGPSQSQVKISSMNTRELENNKENKMSPTVSKDKQTSELSIENSSTAIDTQINVVINSSHYEDCSSNKIKCSFDKSTDRSGNKNTSNVAPLLNIDQNILCNELKLQVSINEKMNMSDNIMHGNEFADSHKSDVVQDNSLGINCSDSSNDREDSSNLINLKISNEVSQKRNSVEEHPEINNIHSSMNNIVQFECPETSEIYQMNVMKQNTLSTEDKNPNTISEIIRNKTLNDLQDILSQECVVLSQKIQNVKNSGSVSNHEKETNILWNESTFKEPVATVRASTVAALKRRATELKKLKQHNSELNMSDVKRCENQRLISSVIHKQLIDKAFSEPSTFNTVVSSASLQENNDKDIHCSVKQLTPRDSISGNTINELGKKYFTYTTPVLIYEDRIGALNDESENFRKQMTNRGNITVPEFIINLTNESDSGDDSDDNKSSRQQTVDIAPDMDKEQGDKIPLSATISRDFEKKLDVLLKEARFQQESNTRHNKGNIVAKEASPVIHPNRQNEVVASTSTTFLQGNELSSNASQGCARVLPRSTVKKLACSRAGTIKAANQRIRSVVIKNSLGNLHRDRTIYNDRTTKHIPSTTVNSSRQVSKGGNRGKITRQTSSMADIGLLPPLKQKEYLKLKRQIVQMTQKRRSSRSEAFVIHTDKTGKQEDTKLKQTLIKTPDVENNTQEVTGQSIVPCEEGTSYLHNISLSEQEKIIEQNSHHTNLHFGSGNKTPEFQTNSAKHCHQASENYPCHEHYVKDVNIIDKEDNILLHDRCSSFPTSNTNQVITISEASITNGPRDPVSACTENAVFQHHNGCSQTSLEGQTSKLSTNQSFPITTTSCIESTLPGKRKICASEQTRKKQKTVGEESEKRTTEVHDSVTKEVEHNNSDQDKLVENLWSSETKLIAKRRQVLEDIATVRLHLYKIEAANFRKDQIIKNVHRLKEELKQVEEKLSQEEEFLKTLNNMVDDSRRSIQRGQSELLSLSLECEELGCKVHGPPNYNVPKTCVDLIRNEMLAMSEAMQELENQKNAM